MFLNGTAMAGQKDHGCHAGSTFLGPARTAARYRFFAVQDTFPALLAVDKGGRVIEGELYEIPQRILLHQLLPAEPAELELSSVELIDGEHVAAMTLRPERLKPGDKVVDISEMGGFRTYQRFLSANAGLGGVLGRSEW
jgi:gamma-glutamylcyclotransferase (GGCT)/AIG2-like uncharacterized protein YtfP